MFAMHLTPSPVGTVWPMLASELPEALSGEGPLTPYGEDIRSAARVRYATGVLLGAAVGAATREKGGSLLAAILGGVAVGLTLNVIVDSALNTIDPTRHQFTRDEPITEG